ncbi:hypothetical protein [Kitasatospora sp. McL0602]|uniref:hypothetical protein n=1 Tax=Kitasatospora sp. McL0602 TaxID=3439530 RepID=UPI003F8CC1D2
MSPYQQSAQPAPAPSTAPKAADQRAALPQVVQPHLHPGETVLGAHWAELDPLLPLYFDAERFQEQLFLLPFRLLWDVVRAFAGVLLPLGLRELLGVGPRYRRRYGLNPFRRLYRAVRRPLHGGSWSGGRESLAGRFWQAVRATPTPYLRVAHDDFVLVLTDRRMLLLSRPPGVRWDRPYDARPLFELPRGAYGLRPEVPGSWWTWRLDLRFSDGSWIALSTGGRFFGLDRDGQEKAQQISRQLG